MAFFYVVNKTSQDLKYYINKYTVVLKADYLNKSEKKKNIKAAKKG
jgi:hypothetical protein